MCYVPDNLGNRRRRDGVSQTAAEFFVKYCEHADKETGLTFANVKTCSEAFEMRIDNAQKYDKELIDKGWIRLIEENGRIYRKVEAGWLPASKRNGQGKAENTAESEFLNFRNSLDNLLNFSESSYILGKSPKFKENLLNFRNAYKEVLNQHTNQPINQQLDHTDTEAAEADMCDLPDSSLDLPKAGEEIPKEKPKRKTSSERLAKLPEDFSITEKMRSWASEKTPNVNIDDELEEFANFWRHIAVRNNQRTAQGWIATWQGRMRELQKRTPTTIQITGERGNGTTKQHQNFSNGTKPTAASIIRGRSYRQNIE